MINCHFISLKDEQLLLSTESVMNIKLVKFFDFKLFDLVFDASTATVDYSFADQSWGKFTDQYLNSYLQEGMRKFLSTQTYSVFKKPFNFENLPDFTLKYIENRGLLFVLKKSGKSVERNLRFLA